MQFRHSSVNSLHSLQVNHSHYDRDDAILGMAPEVFIILSIFVGIVFTITLTIYILYRRYRTRQDYNDNPQLFPHLPQLTSAEEKNLNYKQIKKLIGEPVPKKDEEKLQGISYQLTFTGKTTSAIYFDSVQVKECYFQIEIDELNGPIEIGFIQQESLQSVKNQEETLGSVGVSLSTDGLVVAQGQNVFNYAWDLVYGDVIGIGMTQESDKFNQRRTWVSKNGILLNHPPANEMDKWLATVQITAKERQEYNIGKQKVGVLENKQGNDQQLLAAKQKADKASSERQQALLQKQKITLKTFKKYRFYPVVYFLGNKNDGKKNKDKQSLQKTVIRLNVGGQIFRMQEHFFKGGVLKGE